MSVRDVVQAWDARHGANDVPLWAEVLGTLLAVGLVVRAGSHVWAAIAAGVDPHVDAHDVRAANIVPAAREHPTVDLGGRLLAAFLGVLAFALVDPAGLTWGGPAWFTVGARALAVANVGLLIGDPALFAWERLRTDD